MFKRKTSKVRNRRQVKVLKANVMSPRIFWFDVRHALARFFKLLLWLALLGAVGYGVWMGLDKGLVKNEEFRLQEIVVADNPAIDEIRLLEVAGIDPSGSLFDCDSGKIEAKLLALPEIAGAEVRREFPGTLEVAVTVREPLLWVSDRAQGVMPRDRVTGLLVDRSGLAFPCPKGLYERASKLPVIALGQGGEPLRAGKRVNHPDFVRGMRLYSVVRDATPDAERWVDTIRQHKSWASKMTTRDGIEATFGHDELDRQMGDLLAAVEHARENGDRIATIQLIGRRNLPVTLHEPEAPRAILVEPAPIKVRPQNERDLNDLLER
ncbi:MAG: FtsQ-type POTRA domain-containing protein [Verrucomicrobiota bacterium]